MTSNGSLDSAAASKLPAVSGTPVFLSQSESSDAANYLATNWAKAIG
jgi:putative spermidine/putrescine transport system substrate-binding protein